MSEDQVAEMLPILRHIVVSDDSDDINRWKAQLQNFPIHEVRLMEQTNLAEYFDSDEKAGAEAQFYLRRAAACRAVLDEAGE